MAKKRIGLAFSIALVSAGAAAQTTVTSSGTAATPGNVPYVSAATGTSTTISPSPITVSNGNVGMETKHLSAMVPIPVLGK